jgi:phosphoribosylaminoimidazolecarboxamide formyltransferase/IMP cyclohydrolase
MEAAFSLANEFKEPAVAVIKHKNPCGCACGRDFSQALLKAYDADSISAWGGVYGFNGKVDEKSARFLEKKFVDCIIAPGFEKRAIEILGKKKTVLAVAKFRKKTKFSRETLFGCIVEKDRSHSPATNVVTKAKPGKRQMEDLLFAWKVVKHTTSNAVVIAKNRKTLAICGGAPSRIRAVEICKNYIRKQKGAVLASDGFFPFPDSIMLADKMLVKAVIQPGGSVRDKKVIEEADKRGISMVFTGQRCFSH